MRHTFVLPGSFDPLEFLPGRLMLHADEARWLMSTILRKTADRAVDLWGCVRLDVTILRRIMEPNSIAGIVKALEGGAIETSTYRAGTRCRGYRLAKRWLGDRCVRRPCIDPRLIARLDAERQRLDAQDTRAAWLPVHHALDAEQRALSIDAAAADAILDGLPEHSRLCQDVLVTDLRRQAKRFSVGGTGRVFNAITALKRELRGAVRLAGQRMGCVDLVNSQPALLVVEMLHNSPPNGPKGRETYKHKGADCLPPFPCPPLPSTPASLFPSLALDGGLYEFLAQRTGLSRDVVKLALLRDVLAKRGRYPSPVEDVFRLEFPEVFAFVRSVNRDDHAELIRRLQRRESWLVVENVAPRLVGIVPVVTLHDAIFSRIDGLDTVEAAFEEVFDVLGFRLALKREGHDDE